MSCITLRTPADRLLVARARKGLVASLVIYLLLNVAIMRQPGGAIGNTLACLTGVFFGSIMICSAVIVYRSLDEFQRALITRSFLWATCITMVFAAIWGYAEEFGSPAVPHIPPLIFPAILVVLTSVAKVLIFCQNRPAPETQIN